MKLALITDPNGFGIVEELRLSYHLALAPEILKDPSYARFYRNATCKGDFVMMDNGAAEEGTLSVLDLVEAMNMIHPDEVVLPDVLRDSQKTIEATCDKKLLNIIPPIKRAVVPQGKDANEWLACASFMVNTLEFATMCIPKHAENFECGRSGLLSSIMKLGWHKSYHIHLLGLYGNPFFEITVYRVTAPWVRGIDTAAPFAFAQNHEVLSPVSSHKSHKWGMAFTTDVARENARHLLQYVTEAR